MELSAVNFCNARGQTAHKRAVVAHEDKSPFPAQEKVFQIEYGVEIEVVGRLV